MGRTIRWCTRFPSCKREFTGRCRTHTHACMQAHIRRVASAMLHDAACASVYVLGLSATQGAAPPLDAEQRPHAPELRQARHRLDSSGADAQPPNALDRRGKKHGRPSGAVCRRYPLRNVAQHALSGGWVCEARLR